MENLTADVIEIIRGTTHDGPGMRTTVFLKSCPLSCLWCQNPEGISTEKEIWWEERTCIACLACVDACPSDALADRENGIRRDLGTCNLCGACVEECPSGALSFTSEEWTIDALVTEALKNKDYFHAFEGGVTVSGGEPLVQYPFVSAFFMRLQEEGVHTALDTCGLVPSVALDSVLPFTDHVLFDIKIMDPNLHEKYTGQSNETILGNLRHLAGYIREFNRKLPQDGIGQKKLWIRTPLIPDATASTKNIHAIGTFLYEQLPDVVDRWELCAFNSACNSKYAKMGWPWTFSDVPLMTQGAVDHLVRAAQMTGFAEDKLVVSGLIAT